MPATSGIEVVTGGARGGLWNFNTDKDTATSPVTGRFRTNSGNYRDATQIAIHATTIQSVNRADTLRTLLVDDIIQCQDLLIPAAWCRLVVQAPPVDRGTWFQVNVALEADGNVKSSENQEIVVLFTANSNAVANPVFAESTAYVQTTAAMAGGLDTKPQQTDGVQLLTASITPKRASNKLRIQATIPFGTVGDDGIWFALFRDNDPAAISASISASAKNTASIAKLDLDIPASKALPTTIKLRAGNMMGKTQIIAFNGGATARWMGGASRITLSLTEHT